MNYLLFIHLAFSSKLFLGYTFFIVLRRKYLSKKTYPKASLYMYFLIQSCYKSWFYPPLTLYIFPLLLSEDDGYMLFTGALENPGENVLNSLRSGLHELCYRFRVTDVNF